MWIKYFYDVKVTAEGKSGESSFLIISSQSVKENDPIPPLTEVLLKQESGYISFASRNSSKRIGADYIVYSTEISDEDFNKINPERYEEHFRSLIEDSKASKISSGELIITPSKKAKKRDQLP